MRMEDIDPPREMPGAADDILRTLERYGLTWDAEVLYQSQRHHAYDDAQQWLINQGLAYYCDCTRKLIKANGGHYDGHCRTRQLPPEHCALRLNNQIGIRKFSDLLLGHIDVDAQFSEEDFIIHRRDGLYAYQLAVVVDDAFQGITEVVRGNDLLETTVRQLTLYQSLELDAPQFLHLPLAVQADGNKLSKQNHAPAITADQRAQTLSRALAFLGFSVPDFIQGAEVEQQLQWALTNFELSQIPTERKILLPQ